MLGSQAAFHLIMIKPAHYGDDGYPIQWMRSAVPSNTLACLNGIAEMCRKNRVLGPNTSLIVTTFDEANQRVRPGKILKSIKPGDKALVAFVGVQSNQFPRAVDLAAPFREKNIPVCIGGFHVSGCLSMLPELPDDLKSAQAAGISLFAGEAEDGRFEIVLKDAFEGALKPLYNFMSDLPDLANQPMPILPLKQVRRTAGAMSSFDLGRGCPYQCSFCTIINVQGRKSRFRSPDDLEAIIRENYAQNIKRFFITDDNFARNRNWEAFFDRLIAMRERESMKVKFTIQVDTLCHQIPNFIEKAKRAGVSRVFIGLENINPDSLLGAHKRQNKITDYRTMLQAWKRLGIITYAGYIIGFPNDTKETVKRDIEIIKRELPVDILEFFMLTPLPGSEDHQTLHRNGVWMDPDMNKYDTNHLVTHHPTMSDADWDEAYQLAWSEFYTPQHMETVMRRAKACGMNAGKILIMMFWFFFSIRYEKVHPLEGGYFRLKFRRDRRAGFPRESMLAFYSRYAFDTVRAHFWMAYWLIRMDAMRRRVNRGVNKNAHPDLALQEGIAGELDELTLFTATRGGSQAVVKKRAEDAARGFAKARLAGKSPA